MSSAHAKANIFHRNPENDFDFLEKIGSGTYGEVYKVNGGRQKLSRCNIFYVDFQYDALEKPTIVLY